jgi:hypothetical protein
VIDMAQIELDRLLNCTVDELTALVKPLSANNCERYARAILGRIGGPSFEQLMIRIIQSVHLAAAAALFTLSAAGGPTCPAQGRGEAPRGPHA